MHVLFPVCTSVPAPSFYQDFIEGLEEALAELGHSSERFEFREVGALAQDELQRFFAWGKTAKCDWVLDLCCWGFGLSRARLWDGDEQVGATVLDSLGAHHAALLFDQPYFQPLPWVKSDSLVVGYPDRGHPEIIRALYPLLQSRTQAFVPPASRPCNDRAPARWQDKRIPILYAGNLAPGAIEPFWSDAPQRRLYDAVAELIEAQPQMPLHRLIEAARQSLGLELNQEESIEAHRTLEFHSRHRLRHRLITAIAAAGLPLELYGSGWSEIDLPANVRRHPETDYRSYLELIGAARICLDTSTYMDGANDRVFHFAINRAVFFTNADKYLREVFGADTGACYYSPRALPQAVDRLRELLADPRELARRGEISRDIALGGHLWRDRLATLSASVGT